MEAFKCVRVCCLVFLPGQFQFCYSVVKRKQQKSWLQTIFRHKGKIAKCSIFWIMAISKRDTIQEWIYCKNPPCIFSQSSETKGFSMRRVLFSSQWHFDFRMQRKHDGLFHLKHWIIETLYWIENDDSYCVPVLYPIRHK